MDYEQPTNIINDYHWSSLVKNKIQSINHAMILSCRTVAKIQNKCNVNVNLLIKILLVCVSKV